MHHPTALGSHLTMFETPCLVEESGLVARKVGHLGLEGVRGSTVCNASVRVPEKLH